MTQDERYMALALQIADMGRGQTSPNPMVGAVVVKDGEIVGQGAHLKAGGPHAEVHALQMAGERARGATVYVTLEPCSHFGRTPPCSDALIAAGVRRVVMAMKDPNPAVNGGAAERLRQHGIEVCEGVLAARAARQNEAYLTWRKRGRPFVVWKAASTLDGYAAASTGHSRFVTSPEARLDVQSLRRSLAGICVGIGTVLADDPKLTVRDSESQIEAGRERDESANSAGVPWLQPIRVVFDSQLRMPTHAAMLRQPGQTWIYTTAAAANRRGTAPFGPGAEVIAADTDDSGRPAIDKVLKNLGDRGLSSLLLEGGPALASAFLRAGVVDKVVYYIAPKLLLGGIPSLAGGSPQTMQDALELTDVTMRQIGSDVKIEGYVQGDRRDGTGVYRTD